MGSYDSMLEWLIQYRKRLGMTQEQLGENIGMSQERYSYLENGVTKISAQNLKAFIELGWNVDYLITGVDYKNNILELQNVFCEFAGEHESDLVIKFLAEVILLRAKKYEYAEDKKDDIANIDLLDYLVQFWNDFSMILFVRKKLELSQISMAEKLGVGIKKYRELERENKYADAEILLHLYHMTGYQPTLFLNISDRKMSIMSLVWNQFHSEEKENMIELIKRLKVVL